MEKQSKILIVEDEKNILLSIKMYLKNQGYLLETAENGLEAIEKAQIFLPHLILLDIKIPKMNGFVVCKILKGEPETKEIPVIFMSAKTQQEDIKDAFESGGDDYIAKPFTHKELQPLINKFIKGE